MSTSPRCNSNVVCFKQPWHVGFQGWYRRDTVWYTTCCGIPRRQEERSFVKKNVLKTTSDKSSDKILCYLCRLPVTSVLLSLLTVALHPYYRNVSTQLFATCTSKNIFKKKKSSCLLFSLGRNLKARKFGHGPINPSTTTTISNNNNPSPQSLSLSCPYFHFQQSLWACTSLSLWTSCYKIVDWLVCTFDFSFVANV